MPIRAISHNCVRTALGGHERYVGEQAGRELRRAGSVRTGIDLHRHFIELIDRIGGLGQFANRTAERPVGISIEPDAGAVAGLKSRPVFIRYAHPHDPVGPAVARNQVDRSTGRHILARVGNLPRYGAIHRRPNLSVVAGE